MRFQTAPTGPGENIELPKYFIKLHQTEPTGLGYSAHHFFLKLTPMGAVPNRTYRAWVSKIGRKNRKLNRPD